MQAGDALSNLPGAQQRPCHLRRGFAPCCCSRPHPEPHSHSQPHPELRRRTGALAARPQPPNSWLFPIAPFLALPHHPMPVSPLSPYARLFAIVPFPSDVPSPRAALPRPGATSRLDTLLHERGLHQEPVSPLHSQQWNWDNLSEQPGAAHTLRDASLPIKPRREAGAHPLAALFSACSGWKQFTAGRS